MPEDTLDFKARSGLGSRTLYEERMHYKLVTSQIFNNINSNYIDLWYDVPFYGKVDRKGSLVVPKKKLLTYGAKDNLVSFDFVHKAYNDFRFYIKRNIYVGHTQLQNLFGDFQVKNSFEDSTNEYAGYSKSMVEFFNKQLIASGKFVINPKSYVAELLKFLKTNNLVFSYYSFFASQLTSIGSTGLALELLQGKNFDDDPGKGMYFDDIEFDKYVKAAAKFGFRVNKNAPWMLIADLNSKPMQFGHTVNRHGKDIKIDGYLAQGMIPSIDYLFEKQYDKVINIAYYTLKIAIYEGYSDYANKMRILVTPGKRTFTPDANFKSASTAEITRQPDVSYGIAQYSFSEFLEAFTDCFFLRIFERILRMEYKTKNSIKYKQFRKKFLKQSKDIMMTNSALGLLEKFYNPTIIHDPKTRKPFWTNSRGPKNFLTFANTGDMIPSEKEKPTASKIVTEFYTGY